MKTKWLNIATGTAKSKKYHVPKLTKHTSRHTRISIICPWCDSVMSPEKWALINKGINCTCGALLTDQGNAYKEEG